MSATNSATGQMVWADLTVDDAAAVRDFYSAVIGWTSTEVEMGGYSDFGMKRPSDGQTAAGICWQRGVNQGLPKQWLIYFAVTDLNASVRQVQALGGKVLRPPTSMGGYGTYCVIEDPAGAVAALIQQTSA